MQLCILYGYASKAVGAVVVHAMNLNGERKGIRSELDLVMIAIGMWQDPSMIQILDRLENPCFYQIRPVRISTGRDFYFWR